MGAALTACVFIGRAAAVSNQEVFARPLITRAYEQTQWTLQNANGSGLREESQSVGEALAGLQPSYISGLIYLEQQTELTDQMIDDWNTIRSIVHSTVSGARLDVEISLNPDPPSPKTPFASADAVRAKMESIHATLNNGGWWFDFYSQAQQAHPDWIAAAVEYAHSNNQTVGGNVFGNKVPPGSDAVAFVDDIVSGSEYGFDFNTTEIADLKASPVDALVLGHLQSNSQNGDTTESAIYIDQWTEAKRLSYLEFWDNSQSQYGFTFMWPVFYPLYPGAMAFDPLTDYGTGNHSLYDHIQTLILGSSGD